MGNITSLCRLSLLLVTAIAAGVGCGAPPCRSASQACAVTSDCCDGLACSVTRSVCEVPMSMSRCGDGRCDPGETMANCCTDCGCGAGLACKNNVCLTPASCPAAAPIDCGATLPGKCCQTRFPVCCAKDGACHISAADCNSPSCSGKACSTSADCCAGFTCSRFGHTCHAAKNLDIGDACTDDTQCASKACSGYCTKPCAQTAECGATNNCLDTASGFLCIPFCSTNADCTVFGPGVTCQKSPDPGGLMLSGCFSN